MNRSFRDPQGIIQYEWGCLHCDWQLSGSTIPISEGNLALMTHKCARNQAATPEIAGRRVGEVAWTGRVDNTRHA